VRADVTRRGELADLVQAAADHLGRIDIVVNNAGGMESFSPFLQTSEPSFRFHFEWNTASAFLLSQLTTPYMLKVGKGAILNISSGAGQIGIRACWPTAW
jgi:NAD(P)-dependent dehydrogenase (short-subunit alcohol dehydrogenase family)